MQTTLQSKSRRALAVAGGIAATVGGATVQAQAAALTLRLQNTFAPQSLQGRVALDFAERVGAMSGKELRIEVLPLPAGAKVAGVLDAVADGKVDASLGYPSHWFERLPALGLWASGPAFGMDAHITLAWHANRGADLLREAYRQLRADVDSTLLAALPSLPLGWFKKPIERVDDLDGLVLRSSGLAAEMMRRLKCKTQSMSAGEAVAALKAGKLGGVQLDHLDDAMAAEVATAAPVCMVQSYHAAAPVMELLWSKKRPASLSGAQQVLLQVAARASGVQAYRSAAAEGAKSMARFSGAADGASVVRTPEAVLLAQLSAWDQIVAARSYNDELFARVVESQRSYARGATRWREELTPDFAVAHRHYFKRLAVSA